MNAEGKAILWAFSLIGFIAVLGSEMHTVWKILMFFLLFLDPIFLGVLWLYRRIRP